MQVILISGEIASGKTTLAQGLGVAWPGEVVSVRQILIQALGHKAGDRLALQREGRELDLRTKGAWLAEELSQRYSSERVIVDSLRTRRQTTRVLEECAHSRLVFVDAPESVRRVWYARSARTDEVKASIPFEMAMAHATEREARDLRAMADLVIRSDDYSPPALAGAVLHELGGVW